VTTAATPAPPPFGVPSPPVYSGAPPARMVLDDRPLGVSPDGTARWLVHVSFRDAQGHSTKLLEGGDIGFAASRGTVAWQTRLRFDGPAAIVSTTEEGPITVRVVANSPANLAPERASTDTRRWHLAHDVVAEAVGPHLVQLGWFPRSARTLRILRTGSDGATTAVAIVAPPSSTYRDATVVPGARYRYRVAGAEAAVGVSPDLRTTTLEVLRGKGMWLSFSPSERDPDAYTKLDPAALIRRARFAGLRSIELRTAYGEFWEIPAPVCPAIDALLDEAAGSGIAVLGWTVPRAPSYGDLALAYATAAYRTARGNGFAGLAVDLERGEGFLGSGAQGRAAIADYVRLLRAALGPRYLLVATVEDPYLAHLSEQTYPYAEVAVSASALQPMTYWKMMSRTRGAAAIRACLEKSLFTVRREARRLIAVNVGGAIAGAGKRDALSAAELSATLDGARRAGALGAAFFDWGQTQPYQWDAISRFHW
jgi:hypothetical protein